MLQRISRMGVFEFIRMLVALFSSCHPPNFFRRPEHSRSELDILIGIEDLLINFGLHQFQEDTVQFLEYAINAGNACELLTHGKPLDLVNVPRAAGFHRTVIGLEHTTGLAQHLMVIVQTVRTCTAEHSVSITEPMYILGLEIMWKVLRNGAEKMERARTLQVALAKYCQPQVEPEFKCPHQPCANTGTTSRARFLAPLPPALIIQLKRFNGRAKLEHRVTFPLTLQLPNHPHTHFKLYAVGVHVGNREGGHYYAYIRKRFGQDECWFRANDSHVRPVPKEDVLLTQDAYVLVYEQQIPDYRPEAEVC